MVELKLVYLLTDPIASKEDTILSYVCSQGWHCASIHSPNDPIFPPRFPKHRVVGNSITCPCTAMISRFITLSKWLDLDTDAGRSAS